MRTVAGSTGITTGIISQMIMSNKIIAADLPMAAKAECGIKGLILLMTDRAALFKGRMQKFTEQRTALAAVRIMAAQTIRRTQAEFMFLLNR